MSLPLLYLLIYLATLSLTWLIVNDRFPPIAVPKKALIRVIDRPNPQRPQLDPKASTAKTFAVTLWYLLKCAGCATGRSFAYLLTCGFCSGFWVACAVVFVTATYISVPLPWLVVFAARILTGIAMSAYARAEERWQLTLRQRWIANEELRKLGLEFPEED